MDSPLPWVYCQSEGDLAMTQPTVTLPREVEIRAAFHKSFGPLANYQSYEGSWFIAGYNAALDAPAKPVDCRGCMNLGGIDTKFCGLNRMREPCTDFDLFQALPPINLTRVTK